MRRAILALIVVGGILLVPFLAGGPHRAVADAEAQGFVHNAEGFSGDVSVAAAGGAEEPNEDESMFAVADEDREDARDGDRGERRRSRHHHGPHDGRHRHGPPPHDMHHRGPPGHHGPHPGLHHAMRRFDEVIERLAKIEAKLGIDDPAPVRRERRPWPDDRDAARRGDGPYRPGGQGPAEAMDRSREEWGAAIRQRMEDARRRFSEMEERVKKLEAEIERMKAADRGP